MLYELITAYEKDNRKERRKILEKDNMIIIKTRKKIMNNQWIENILIIKKSRYSNKNNYNNRIMQKEIISKNDMSTTSFMIKLD